MKKNIALTGAIFALTMIGTAGIALAQDDSGLTAEELVAKFAAQQHTRGLVIAPAEGTVPEDPNALPADTTYVAMEGNSAVNIQIKFGFDSASLGDSEMSKLTTLCEVIKTSDIPQFKIIGHTDSSGTDSYNENLSKLRAEEVKRHLVDDCGVPDGKLIAVGVGEAFPLDNDDPKAEVNRRVEFQVVG